MMIKIPSLFFLLLLISCASTPPTTKEENPELQIVYSVDKEGLFLYDFLSGATKKIYTTDQVFLEKHFEFLNDSIVIVGHQGASRSEDVKREVYSKYFYKVGGDSTFITDHPPYTVIDKHVFVTETFFAVNLNNGSSYRYKTFDYEHIEHDTIHLKTKVFNPKGEVVFRNDSTFSCWQTSGTYKGIVFCGEERYVSHSEVVKGRYAFTQRGDLYMVNQKDTSLFLKFDGNFEPKFGSGYYTPSLSPDGTRMAFKYLAGFLKSGSAVFEMNLATREKRKLAGEEYFKPMYSPDGKKLLLAKDQEQTANKTWVNTIYVLDISSGKFKKIGAGIDYRWRPKK